VGALFCTVFACTGLVLGLSAVRGESHGHDGERSGSVRALLTKRCHSGVDRDKGRVRRP